MSTFGDEKMSQTDEERKAEKRKYDREYSSRPEVKAKEKERRQRPENKEYMKKYHDVWDSKPENKKKRRQYDKDLRLKICSVYSKRHSNSDIPCCRCCGENTDIRFLAVDHIDGRKNLPKEQQNLDGDHLISWLKQNNCPEGYQILCHNCNSAKGHSKNNKCPHERTRLEETFAMMEEQSSFEL
jgi:hypothetical protein